MPANIEIQSDAGVPLTAWNFGAVQGSGSTQQRFLAKNTGSVEATNVQIELERLVQNDGIDFVEHALDASGNPGTYQEGPLNIGTLPAGDEVAFWVRIEVPLGTSPQGNMRQFLFGAEYTGT